MHRVLMKMIKKRWWLGVRSPLFFGGKLSVNSSGFEVEASARRDQSDFQIFRKTTWMRFAEKREKNEIKSQTKRCFFGKKMKKLMEGCVTRGWVLVLSAGDVKRKWTGNGSVSGIYFTCTQVLVTPEKWENQQTKWENQLTTKGVSRIILIIDSVSGWILWSNLASWVLKKCISDFVLSENIFRKIPS